VAMAPEPSQPSPEYRRLGVVPTPDDGERVSERAPWDESTRPHRAPAIDEVEYSDNGRQVAQHLVDVHDMLRRELTELRDIVSQVRAGALDAGDARSALNEMAMRQTTGRSELSARATATPSRATTDWRMTRSSRISRAATRRSRRSSIA
jgi:hypothetical protein